MKHLHDRLIARLGTWCQCFVQTFSSEASATCDCSNPARFRNCGDRCEENFRILIFKRSAKKLSNSFFVVQIVGRIKPCELAHNLLLKYLNLGLRPRIAPLRWTKN